MYNLATMSSTVFSAIPVGMTMIVIPTYNEAENLSAITRELFALNWPDLHVLIVDDASPDGTGELAERLRGDYPGRFHVIHRPGKQGLGTAYVTGFRYALEHGADYIVQMDADFSHSPAYVPCLLAHLDQYDVVVGSRYVPGAGWTSGGAGGAIC